MEILPIVSKYGFRKRNENPVIKTLDTEISNLNRIGQRVNEKVSVIDPFVYLKKVKGVELNKEDNLTVSPKNLIPVEEFNNYSLWDFPNPSGTTLIDLNISFDNSEELQIDWGDGTVETIISDNNYSHTYS